MTLEIGILFAMLLVMAYLFFTEKLPVDLTAFMGLATMVLCGFVEPREAFTGFASPAVITMLSIFFVSAALLQTGLADVVAKHVHRLLGSREIPLIVAIMAAAGILSAFMNNIAACAVLLPAVSSLSKKAKVSPSRLFMPLSFGAILGGTTTLVGTPPNILAGELLRENGVEPFGLFDFTPMGLMLLGVGIVFMVFVGRRLLPERSISAELSEGRDLAQVYKLKQSLFSIRVPKGSRLDGASLGDIDLGRSLGVQVVAIKRGSSRKLAPQADSVIQGNDILVVQGRFSDVQEMFRVQGVEIGTAKPGDLARASDKVSALSAVLSKKSSMAGRTLKDVRFRSSFGTVVVGIRRNGELLRTDLARQVLQAGDEIYVVGSNEKLERMSGQEDFENVHTGRAIFQDLQGHLFLLRIPGGSQLAGASIGESRMGELVGLTVLGIVRGGRTLLAVEPDEKVQAEDELLVTGQPRRIQGLLGLGDVELQRSVSESGIESETVGVEEATVAPRSGAAGRTLAELNFREKYGLQVLAVWREGSPIYEGLANLPLRFGDALLLQGPWDKFRLFGKDRNYVLLSPHAQEARRMDKAPYAIGALALMIICVVTGFQPIHVAAFLAAIVVVLSRAISMEEAYRAVEWKAIFLVAAILPVGIAMEETGAARLLSESVTSSAGPFGSYALLAALCFLSSLLSQCLDGAPAVVLLTPVALQSAADLGISKYPVMMGVSLAASAAFMTPFSHKANLLVMGAGGYRVADYLRVGTPLTVVLLILMVLMAPFFFPF